MTTSTESTKGFIIFLRALLCYMSKFLAVITLCYPEPIISLAPCETHIQVTAVLISRATFRTAVLWLPPSLGLVKRRPRCRPLPTNTSMCLFLFKMLSMILASGHEVGIPVTVSFGSIFLGCETAKSSLSSREGDLRLHA